MIIAAFLLAAACIPEPGNIPGFSTVTPTIRGDHDRLDTVLIRVYAKRPEDTSWTWVYEIPYAKATIVDDEGNIVDYMEFATGILSDLPIQRVIPTEIQLEDVRFTMKAVDEDGNESAPSNIVTICPPLLVEF